MTSSTADKRSSRAFTLLELLTAIAIILLLAGLLLPTLSRIRTRSLKAAAIAEVKNLETAWNQYLTEYQTWPATFNGSNSYAVAGDVSRLLEADNVLGNANPKTISFMHFTRYNAASNPISPWGKKNGGNANDLYYCKFDTDYDETIPGTGDTNDPPATAVRRSVIVWTINQDARTTDGDYIIGSWQQ